MKVFIVVGENWHDHSDIIDVFSSLELATEVKKHFDDTGGHGYDGISIEECEIKNSL